MRPITRSAPPAGLPIRYLLVFWLFVLSAIAYLDRTNVSIAGIQIEHEFGIDSTHLGWAISAFLIGYAIFQVPAGLLAKQLGARRALALGVIWWGVFTALTAAVRPGAKGGFLLLLSVRLALGAGEAIMYPAASQFVAQWFPVRERGKANGIIFGGVGVGSGLAPPLVTAIMLAHGWRASFWFSTVIGIAGGLVWYFAARDTPEEHGLVSEQERAHIIAGRDLPGAVEEEADRPGTPWRQLLGNRSIWAVTLSYFAFGYVAWIFFGWFYLYLVQVRGLSLKSSASFSTLPFIAMTIGCLLGGVVSDWITRTWGLRIGRCFLSSASLTLTALLLVLGSQARSGQMASVILAAGAAVLYFSQSCFWAVIADLAGKHTGVASGMMNMGAQVGGASTASLTPLIAAHFGWGASFATAATIALIGAGSWLLVKPTIEV